jgi:hypothetical protein
MAELRHATAAATRASGSPSKRDAETASASAPLVASPRGGGKDGPRASLPLHQRWSLPPPVRSLLAFEDPRSLAASAAYRILVAAVACLALAALLLSAPSVWSRLVSYLIPCNCVISICCSSRSLTWRLRLCPCWTLERAIPMLEGGDPAPLPPGNELLLDFSRRLGQHICVFIFSRSAS